MSHYKTLGVSEGCSQDEIKKAFRALALQYHPDRNPNNPDAEKTFKEINAAYEVLGDPEKRSIYDQSLRQPPQNSWANPEDIFADLFGHFGSRRFGQNPFNPFSPFGGGGHGMPKYMANLNLSLADTLKQNEHTFKIDVKKACQTCKGTAEAAKPVRCNVCQGTGVHLGVRCGGCKGFGSIYKQCETCNGTGGSTEPQEIKVTIPRGIISNCQLRVNTAAGPIDLTVNVQYPEGVKLGGDGKLVKDVGIPYHIAILGGIHPVQTIEEGEIKVKFPPSQHGQLIKIKGKGVYPGPNSQERGDLFLKPYVTVPKLEDLGEDEKTLIEKIASLYTTSQE